MIFAAFFAGLAIGLAAGGIGLRFYLPAPSRASDIEDLGELELWNSSGPARPGSDGSLLMGWESETAARLSPVSWAPIDVQRGVFGPGGPAKGRPRPPTG